MTVTQCLCIWYAYYEILPSGITEFSTETLTKCFQSCKLRKFHSRRMRRRCEITRTRWTHRMTRTNKRRRKRCGVHRMKVLSPAASHSSRSHHRSHNKAFFFVSLFTGVICSYANLYKVLTLKPGMWWVWVPSRALTSARLPCTGCPPPRRWCPARPCGWPAWSGSAPRTWFRSGTPRGCRGRWCAGCRCSPAPPWCSLGRARSSSPGEEEGEGESTVCLAGSGAAQHSKAG